MWVVESEKFCYQSIIWLIRTQRCEFQANRTTGWPANIWSKSTRSVGFQKIKNYTLKCNTKYIYLPKSIYEIVLKQLMIPDVSKNHWTSWLWPYVCRSTSCSIDLKFTAPGSFESKNRLILKLFQFDHPHSKNFVILMFDLYNEKWPNLRHGPCIHDDINISRIVSASSTSSAWSIWKSKKCPISDN